MKKTVLKTSLDHLPDRHHKNLDNIVEAIIRQVQPEMIILFGSYARGDYVERDYTVEDGITYAYISDYDILIATERSLNSEQLRAIKKRIDRKHLMTPATIIEETVSSLNEKIRDSHYFYVDLVKDGIMLHDSGKYELEAPQRLRPEKKLAKAREYFQQWMGKADNFYKGFNFYLKEQNYAEAAFMLHQAVENAYNTFLLVATDYKPKTHELDELRKMAIQIYPAHQEIFAIKSQEDEDRWVLLCKAYVDARYKKDYSITLEELQHLDKEAKSLIEFVRARSEEELK